MPHKESPSMMQFSRVIPYILIIGGIIGLICSFIILQDKIDLLTNPQFHPNCDLNPIISCGDVMTSKQGSVLGFPNPIIGMSAFAVLTTLGVAILAGGQFKKWLWQALDIGLLLAVVFVHWLFFQSVYQINALCPYCMVVWVVTITTFWYVTLYNISSGNLVLPISWRRVGQFARHYHLELLTVWFLIIIVLILQHFWYFYGKYL